MWKLLFVVSVIVLVWYAMTLIGSIKREIKADRERMRRRGCHCRELAFGGYEMSPECPVHCQWFTLREIRLWTGQKFVTPIGMMGRRIWLCPRCLNRIKPDTDRLFYNTSVEECNECKRVTEVMAVPVALLRYWHRRGEWSSSGFHR